MAFELAVLVQKIGSLEVGQTICRGDLEIVRRHSWRAAYKRTFVESRHDTLQFVSDIVTRVIAESPADLVTVEVGVGNLEQSYSDDEKIKSGYRGLLDKIASVRVAPVTPAIPIPTPVSPPIAIPIASSVPLPATSVPDSPLVSSVPIQNKKEEAQSLEVIYHFRLRPQ